MDDIKKCESPISNERKTKLFTPCRQMGLSRKRKTFSSPVNSSPLSSPNSLVLNTSISPTITEANKKIKSSIIPRILKSNNLGNCIKNLNKEIKSRNSLEIKLNNSPELKKTEISNETENEMDCNLNELTSEELMYQINCCRDRIKIKRKKYENMKLNCDQNPQRKHILETLNNSIILWKSGCQSALEELLEKLKEIKNEHIDMNNLLEHLNISKELLNYDEESECFK